MKKAFAAERKTDSGPRTALGTLLIEEGVIDSAQLEEALRLGTESGERLGEILVRMGWATEDDLARILAHQWNLRCLERSAISFDPNALAKLSREDATTLEALPMRIADDGSLVVAVAEPTEARLFALRSRFGDRIECVVIPKTALDVGLRGDLLAKTTPSRRDDFDEPEDSIDGLASEVASENEPENNEPVSHAPEHQEPAGESEPESHEGSQHEAEEQAAVLELVPEPLQLAAEPEGEDVDETPPPAALAVVADFDEAAGALTSLVEEQLAMLRGVVVEAEQARVGSDQARVSADQARAGAEAARAKAEANRADAQAEVERLGSELAERETMVRDLQQNLRDIADRLLPPPSHS